MLNDSFQSTLQSIDNTQRQNRSSFPRIRPTDNINGQPLQPNYNNTILGIEKNLPVPVVVYYSFNSQGVAELKAEYPEKQCEEFMVFSSGQKIYLRMVDVLGGRSLLYNGNIKDLKKVEVPQRILAVSFKASAFTKNLIKEKQSSEESWIVRKNRNPNVLILEEEMLAGEKIKEIKNIFMSKAEEIKQDFRFQVSTLFRESKIKISQYNEQVQKEIETKIQKPYIYLDLCRGILDILKKAQKEANKISKQEKKSIRHLDSLFPILIQKYEDDEENENADFHRMFVPSAPIQGWQEIIQIETSNELEIFGNFEQLVEKTEEELKEIIKEKLVKNK